MKYFSEKSDCAGALPSSWLRRLSRSILPDNDAPRRDLHTHTYIFRLFRRFFLFFRREQEVTELEARRKAFTNRLPKVRAETEAVRKQEARAKRQKLSAAAPAARSAAPSPRPPPPTSPPPAQRSQSSSDRRYDERRQQQLQQLRREAGAEEGGELSVEDLPYRFLDEDKEPEEGINIYNVDGNIAAAMAAMEAAEAGDAALPRSPSQQQQQQQHQPQQQGQQQAQYSSDAARGQAVAREAPRRHAADGVVAAAVSAASARGGAAAAAAGASSPAPGVGAGATATVRGKVAQTSPPPLPRRDPTADGSRSREAGKGARSERNARRGPGAPQAVTVMGGGVGGGLDDAVVERMAREAEEQMEQMSEDDGVFDCSGMGW